MWCWRWWEKGRGKTRSWKKIRGRQKPRERPKSRVRKARARVQRKNEGICICTISRRIRIRTRMIRLGTWQMRRSEEGDLDHIRVAYMERNRHWSHIALISPMDSKLKKILNCIIPICLYFWCCSILLCELLMFIIFFCLNIVLKMIRLRKRFWLWFGRSGLLGVTLIPISKNVTRVGWMQESRSFK